MSMARGWLENLSQIERTPARTSEERKTKTEAISRMMEARPGPFA